MHGRSDVAHVAVVLFLLRFLLGVMQCRPRSILRFRLHTHGWGAVALIEGIYQNLEVRFLM